MKNFLLGGLVGLAVGLIVFAINYSCSIWAPYAAEHSKNFEGQIVIVIGYDQSKEKATWSETSVSHNDTLWAIQKGIWSDEFIVRCNTPEEAKKKKDDVLKALGHDQPGSSKSEVDSTSK